MTGIFGKLPGHGDFVRRGLPQSFLGPWDAWLQAGVGHAMGAMGRAFGAGWASAPSWRFHLPAGVCGATEVVGVLLPSADAVGREFPLTLAALLPDADGRPADQWFDTLELIGRAARDQRQSVDELFARLPEARADVVTLPPGSFTSTGWWTSDGRQWPLVRLPTPQQFLSLLRGPTGPAMPVGQAATHRGTVRSKNEDAFVERGDIGLWAVADGAGGHGAGDVASSAVAAALETLPTGLSAPEVLAQVRLRLAAVHDQLRNGATASTNGLTPVTTVVVLLVRDGHFACLWAGDSRAYLFRGGALCQLTEDHSLIKELVAASLVKPEDAENHPQANVITRAVGGHEDFSLDKVAGSLTTGDRILLCSDGLFKAIPESAIAAVLTSGGDANALLQRSLQAGARDNVTALVVSV
jgi:serine/threonine protein phosphatase Stp1